MLFCREKFGKPVIKYEDRASLNQFITANGGAEARFGDDGKAHVLSRVKDEDRFVYVLPGSYLRCLGAGQFSAISSRQFEQQFEIVKA